MQILIHDKIYPIPHKNESKFVRKIEYLISKNVKNNCIDKICLEFEFNNLEITIHLKTHDQPQDIEYITSKIFLILAQVSSFPFKKITISSLPLDLTQKKVFTNEENTILFEIDRISDKINEISSIKGISQIQKIKQFPATVRGVCFGLWTDEELVQQSQISAVYKKLRRIEVESLISKRSKNEFIDANFLLERRISSNPDAKSILKLSLIAMLYLFTGKIIPNPIDIKSSIQPQKGAQVISSEKNPSNTRQVNNDYIDFIFMKSYNLIGGSFILLIFILWLRKEFFDLENMEDKSRLAYIKYALELYKELENKSKKD